MKKFVVLIVIVIFTLIPTIANAADMIKSLNINIYINNSGDAKVTEIWDTDTIEHIQFVHPYYNLGSSTIKNLKISDEDTEYETLSPWTYSNQLYKCGLNYIPNGVEIRWKGNGAFSRTYTVEYEITNFVKSLTDSQIIYWTLIPKSHYEFQKVEIEITSDFAFDDSLKFWSYGNSHGRCYISDGKIKMTSNKNFFSPKDSFTILVKIPNGTFNIQTIENNNFEYYSKMAIKDNLYYIGNKIKEIFDIIFKILFVLFFIFGIPLMIIVADYNSKLAMLILIIFGLLAIYLQEGDKDMVILKMFCVIAVIYILIRFTSKNRSVSDADKTKIRKAEYSAEIPYENDLLKSFYIASSYGIIKRKTDLFGAVLLKWLKEKKIYIGKGTFGKKNKQKVYIRLNLNHDEIEELISLREYEGKLYKFLKDITLLSRDIEPVLIKNDFYGWCRIYSNKFLKWFDAVKVDEENKLKNNGEIQETQIGRVFIFKKLIYSDNFFNNALQLSGLKKYLKNYATTNNRDIISTELLEDYLIYAQMFGISNKVLKSFKTLYSEEIQQSNFKSFENVDSLIRFASGAADVAISDRNDSLN